MSKKILIPIIIFIIFTIVGSSALAIYLNQSQKLGLPDIQNLNSLISSSSSQAISSQITSTQRTEFKGAITCGDFTIRYSPDVHQVGLSFDENDIQSYYFANNQEKVAFIRSQKEFDPCNNGNSQEYQLPIYSKGKKLLCYNCDGAWTPDIFLKINKQLVDGQYKPILEEARIISQYPIDIPNVQNARIVTYKPPISINVEHVVKDLSFDYKGNNFLFGINAKDGQSGNHTFRTEYNTNSDYDKLLMEAISGLEINPKPIVAQKELPFILGSKKCGDFNVKFDANKLQVGILDGIGDTYNGITGAKNIKPPYPDIDNEFLNHTQESRTCGKDKLNLRIYPKGSQLPCFGCGVDFMPIELKKYSPEFEQSKEFIKVQKINKPNISNAFVREYQSDGRGQNKFHYMEFVFEYQGVKHSLHYTNGFVPDDIGNTQSAKFIADFEKLVEDLEINGDAGQNIWGKYIPQQSVMECGDFGIKYDPSKYQQGLSYGFVDPNYKVSSEMDGAFRGFIDGTRKCNDIFGELYLKGTKAPCYQCDGGYRPSVFLSQIPEPLKNISENDGDIYVKIISSTPKPKTGLRNSKVVEYESKSYVRPKQIKQVLTFEYKDKNYILELQESGVNKPSDFQSYEEYTKIFDEFVENFYLK